MIVIGITGTLGAGKGTVVEYLVQHHGFTHYSARELITKSLHERGIPVSRDTLIDMANELRANCGHAHIMESLYEKAMAAGENAVIESVRAIAEVDALKKHDHAHLLAVDADPRLRYERIVKRGSETDNVPYEKFRSDEAREMISNDPTKQNIGACMQRANFILENNGTLDDLKRQVSEVIRKIAANTNVK